ncbi:glycoside hydrolase domain-containing protein [Actinopolymorpha sp. B17G11]|uniref:glycoside hydrolase domain-containing protein n=1 Tax=Actinopolymorpha sp. B17G11 TaxID=3160861 RepID=UPI0032E3B03E
MSRRGIRCLLAVPVVAGLVAALLAGAGLPASPVPAAEAAAEAAPAEPDYVSLVNPWVEADIARFYFFQSASNPFSLVKLRPDTSTHSPFDTGYRRNEHFVKGFSHVHDWKFSGIQVMPTSGDPAPKLEGDTGWQSYVEHDDSEVAEPGYHRLHLDRYGITAELTATDRVGLHRYTYDRSGPSEIIVNLGGVLGEATMKNSHVTKVGDRELEGYVVQYGAGYAAFHDTKLYFTIRFDRPFDSFHGWADGSLVDGGAGVDEVVGDDMGVYVRYHDIDAGDQVQMKVGLSLTGLEGARSNLEAELPGWDFNAVRAASRQRWNDMLGRIDVQGGTHQQRVKFYTDLFHILCGRGKVSDVDGTYIDDTWNQGRVRQVPLDDHGKPEFAVYTHDALWLTQWNINTVFGLAYPEISSEFIRSALQMYRNGGILPRGPIVGNYSMVMTGSPITSFIIGAYNKGIRDFDIDLAHDAMLDAHSIGGLFDKAWFDYANWGTGGGRDYLDLGYVPTGTTGQGAGQTLEYAHQDWALAHLARRLDKRGINIAQFADVAVSSQFDAGHAAARAIDGRPERAPTSTEWASAGEQNPWITLTWDEPQQIRKVVVRDRTNLVDNANSGRLTFSDGTTIDVSGIPVNGTAKVVRFAPKTVTWVRFDVTGGTGPNVGLNDVEVWDDRDVADYLMKRSGNWRNLFDRETGFIRPRNADGTWLEPFDPLSPKDFVEANSWQSTWFTSHDVMGLANLMGGEAAYKDRLNYAFVSAEPDNFIGSYGKGYVSYGNQPGVQVAHLFNYVGYPWLTQHRVRQVKEKTFGSISTTDGYGRHDEDQGQMGGISALMAMGLFEVTGGGLERPVYDITSPIFDEITIKLNQDYYSGKQFRIITQNNSTQNAYIQRAELDGRDWDNAWFHHDQLADGGTLELWLGAEPNKQWGAEKLPPSESESAGNTPVLATDITISGPNQVREPYGSIRLGAEFVPHDTSLKKAYWSVTELDGSPTKKATITNDGVLTVNHRDGEVLVTAVAGDSGGARATATVDIQLDPTLLRSNAARWPDATATASSEFSNAFGVVRVHDGFGDGTGDWASAGEQNPWVQLDWADPIQADRIVLYDRTSRDDANSGTLTFSDGSSIKVTGIPPTDPKTVTFDPKTFAWVRFQVEGGIGPNVGLLEFEVYGVPRAPGVPRDVTARAEDGSVAVSWTAPEFTGGVPLTGYVVTPYRDGTALDPINVDEDVTSLVVPDLTAGQPYTFTVTAKNMTGPGPESPPSNVVTPH